MTLQNHQNERAHLPGERLNAREPGDPRLPQGLGAPCCQASAPSPALTHPGGSTPETNYDGELDAWLGLDADALKSVGRIKAAVARVLARRSPGRRVFWRPRLV